MKQKKNIIYLSIIAALAGLLILSHLQTIAYAGPGTVADPLVTQRYVNERIAELQAQITALQNQQGGTGQPGTATLTQAERDALVADITMAVLANINALGLGQGQGVAVPFTPLFVPQGSTLIAEAGAEIVLRSGAANVIAGPNGLVDVTAGADVANGQPVSRNHLMLVPATDGRGLSFVTDAWLMIKGGYTVVN